MAQLHEFQAKKLLAAGGIAIPRGKAVSTVEEIYHAAAYTGAEVVLKAQIHSTSRAAAGGVRFAGNWDEAVLIGAEMLGSVIAGNRVETLLIDEKLPIKQEFYAGYIIDDRVKRPTLLFSMAGGSGIEGRASSMKSFTCSIRKEPILEEIDTFIVYSFPDLPDSLRTQIAAILQNLYRVAHACDARSAEINPLALLENGHMVAVDARISIDDYAVFRHPELGVSIARELGHTPTNLELIAWEIEKDDFRGTFYFVEILAEVESGESRVESEDLAQTPGSPLTTLDSPLYKIGFHGAGGGGSMASLDAAQRNGLEPACYVDTSGNPPASKVYRAAKIILSIPGIEGYFLSGSGVASQEQFGLARGVLKAFLEIRPNIPAVLRLGGNGEEIANEMVERYAAQLPAPIEAYRKKDAADFCAARLRHLIAAEADFEERGFRLTIPASRSDYLFKTRTGSVSFDYSLLDDETSRAVVESCPPGILALDERHRPILAISTAEAERGKCSECLACEFAAIDAGRWNAVRIELPIHGLNPIEKAER